MNLLGDKLKITNVMAVSSIIIWSFAGISLSLPQNCAYVETEEMLVSDQSVGAQRRFDAEGNQ